MNSVYFDDYLVGSVLQPSAAPLPKQILCFMPVRAVTFIPTTWTQNGAASRISANESLTAR
jgi:hypothetical protein